jgi:hypothetical protein
MNREQWENAARFAGIKCHHRNRKYVQVSTGAPCTARCADCGFVCEQWNPDSDWNDFGKLWMKLKHWLAQYPKDRRFPTMEVYEAYQGFLVAESSGTESELMQAGCELAAAMGATMTTASAGDTA